MKKTSSKKKTKRKDYDDLDERTATQRRRQIVRRQKTDQPKRRAAAQKQMVHIKESRLEEIRFLRGEDSPGKETWRTFRIMSELIKGIEKLTGVTKGISMFGSARVKPGSRYYELARRTAEAIGSRGFTIITGGGPGSMEACNRGAKEAGALSIGLNIKLPYEQYLNPYVDITETFNFFFVRKIMLVKYAHAFIICPGGYGTLDEMFEALTLIQTGKVSNFPVILLGVEYWKPLMDWIKNTCVKNGMINAEDLKDVHLVDDPEDAAKLVAGAWKRYIKEHRRELKEAHLI